MTAPSSSETKPFPWWKFAIVQALLLIAAWVLTTCFAWFIFQLYGFRGFIDDEVTIIAFLSLGFAGTNLAAIWFALAPTRLPSRVIVAMVLVPFSLGATLFSFLREMNTHLWLGFALGFIAEFLLVQIPFWIGRVTRGSIIAIHAGSEPEFSPQNQQFTIRELFFITTAIAVLLGLSRALILYGGLRFVIGSSGDFARLMQVLLLMVAFNLLLAWSALLPTFVTRNRWIAFLLAFATLAMSLAVEPPLFISLFPPGGPRQPLLFFASLNVPHFLLLLASFEVARQFGLRLLLASNRSWSLAKQPPS